MRESKYNRMLARLARRTRRTVRLLSDDATPTVPPQRIVVAVGGNALQRRGDRLTIENMLKAAKQMVRSRRPVVLGCFHFFNTTRVHLTMTWVVSFSSLRPFDAPRRCPRSSHCARRATKCC